MKQFTLYKTGITKKAFKLFSWLLVWVFSFSVAGQPLTYLKTAEVHALNFGLALSPTYDSGYVFVGQDKQYVVAPQIYCYFYVTKIDKCGNLSSRTNFELVAQVPRVRSAGARFVRETSDHKYLITGPIQRANLTLTADSLGLYLALVDVDGQTLNWINIYRRPGGEAQGTCVAETTDGYLVCGFVDAEPKKPYLAKVSKTDGSVIWEHAFPSLAGLYSYANYIEVFSNGDILLLGSYGSGSNNNFYAMRLSAAGAILWSKEYDIGTFDGLDWDVSGKITRDGGFLISGSTKSGNNYDCVIIKADANGNVINAATIDNASNDDRARSITELASGAIVQIGFSDFNNGNVNELINKVSNTLTPIWSKTMTLNNYTKGWGINEDFDKGLVFSGETYNSINYEALFIKTDSMGEMPGCSYLQQLTPAFTPRTITASTISPTISNDPYFEYAYTDGEKVVAAGGGTVTDVCYHCNPTFIVDKNQICINDTLQIINVPIRCTPQTVSITETNTGLIVTPTITIADTSVYTFTTAGTYEIKLTVSCNGINTDIVKTVVVHQQPTAFAGNDFMKCRGEAATFTGTGGGTYQWFDTTYSSLISSSSSFTITDTATTGYNLIVTSVDGCKDTSDVVLTINPVPLANFTADTVCLNNPTHLTNHSTLSSGILSAFWTFDENNLTSYAFDTTFVYGQCNHTYNVTLVATSDKNCYNVKTKPVFVNCNPFASYTAANVCQETAAVFANTSTIADTYQWDFDNDSISTFQPTSTVTNPYHNYTVPDTYKVALIATNNEGCKDTVINPIVIYPEPTALFSADSACLHQPTHFTDSSSVSSGSIASWVWNFGDNSALSNAQYPVHVYPQIGTYIVSLIVTTDHGCIDTIIKTILVHPLPAVVFTTANVCDGTTAQFNNSSTIPTGTISSWKWNFGDGSPVNITHSTSHLYAGIGSYPVKLIATSNFGCRDSLSKMIVVNPNPVVSYTANDTIGCEPLCIQFQNNSTIATGNNITWASNFGDGSPVSNTPNSFHCYHAIGAALTQHFTFSMTVTSDSGCVTNLTKNNMITVYKNPVAAFTPSPSKTTVIDPSVKMINQSSADVTYWYWNFGDGDTLAPSISSPVHMYPSGSPSEYTVTLIVHNENECYDTVAHEIIIGPEFTFYIPNAFTPNGDGVNDFFFGSGIGIVEYDIWIFDRWGSRIFHGNHLNDKWDGRANDGKDMAQQDVFVWKVTLTDVFEREHHYIGTVTLVK